MPRSHRAFAGAKTLMTLTKIAFAVVFSIFGMVAQAQAQDVDWLVNINDSNLTVDFDPIAAGGTIEYIVEVANNGDDMAPPTTVSVDVPATTRLMAISAGFTGCRVGATPFAAPVIGPETVVCDVANLPQSGRISSVFSVQTTEAGANGTNRVVELLATVPVSVVPAGGGAPVVDISTTNNSLGEETTVTAGADLSITLVTDATVPSGAFLDFDITVLNNGPNTTDSFTIHFPVPTGVANISRVGGSGLPAGCTNSGGVISCTITNDLSAGSSVVRSFRGQVVAASGSPITSTASVLDGDPTDPISGNNTSVAETIVGVGTDVSIDVVRTGGPIIPVGGTSTFTFFSAYTGNAPEDLTIQTTIPANYTFDPLSDITSGGWSCTVGAGQLVTCTLPGGGVAGTNVPLDTIVIVATSVGTGVAVPVTGTISALTPTETNFDNNTDTAVTTIQAAEVDLRANKSTQASGRPVTGENYSFLISTTNIGNVDYVGEVVMTDNIPTGLTVTDVVENGWACLPASPPDLVGPQSIVCRRTFTALDPLEANETAPTVTITTLITSAEGTDLTNSLVVSGPDISPVETALGNNSTNVTVTAEGAVTSADVGIVKSRSLATVAVGDIQTFQIELTNAGPDIARNIAFEDALFNLVNNTTGATNAGEVSFNMDGGGATGAQCSTAPRFSNGRTLSCTVTELPVCGGVSGVTCPVVTVEVRPGGTGNSRTNTATITSSGTPDPNTSNQSSAVGYTVISRADVTVTKNATPDPALAGQDVTYVVTAINLGTFEGTTIRSNLSQAQAVTITDDLPDNVRFISATPSTGSCATQPAAGALTNNDQLICNLGPLDTGAQETVEIVVRPTNALNGGSIQNDVSVSTGTVELNSDNNTANVSVNIGQPVLDILVNKDDSVDPVVIGSTTVYTIRVTNAGPSASENVVVTDILPASIFAYRSHTISAGGSCATVPIAQVTPAPNPADRTLECQIPILPANASEIIQVTMEAVSEGDILNEVTISSDEIVAGFDTEALNNFTRENTTASGPGDVAVTSKVPNVTSVNLRDSFTFLVTVENNPDTPGSAATGAVLTDTLPTGMVLTAQPTALVTTGTTTINTCTGALNATSFQCNFGNLSDNAVVQITVPVKVISIPALGDNITNTATISATSGDSNSENNSANGVVTVNGSSLAGTVYRDLDNGATASVSDQDPGDLGIEGVEMTLTGTAVDGEMITLMVNTGTDGTYSFPTLPQGTYRVIRGVVNETGFVTGQNTIGTSGGTLPSAAEAEGISLPANTAATGYDFAEIPGATPAAIALLKTADTSAFSNPPQAGEVLTYNFLIRNTGTVTLTDVTLTDTVTGVMLTGTAIPSLAPGEENDTAYSATYVLQPEDLGGQLSNVANVTGSPPEGDDVSDVSGTSLTNNTPTTTNVPNDPPVADNPAISLDKTLDQSALSDGAQVGDVLTYGFIVTNTGNVPLFDVRVQDSLEGLTVIGAPLAQLNPGESDSTTYTASYVLTEDDLAAGQVVNDARAEGEFPQDSGVRVSDEDTETANFDQPVVEEETIDAIPEVFPPFTDGGTTTSMLASDLLNGDPATLDNITLTVLREDPGVTLDPSTTIITLASGLPAGTYEVDYQICSIASPELCDTTTETVVQLAAPGIESTKTQTLTDNGDGRDGLGDTLTYQITVENTGNIVLQNVTVTDTMVDLQGGALTLTTGPSFVSASAGSPAGSLQIGEMATYSATFVVNEQAADALGVENTVVGTGVPTPIPDVPGIPPSVSDTSDDGDDTDGNTVDDPTVSEFPLPIAVIEDGPVTMTKTSTADVVRRGDAVPYTITISNENGAAVGPFTVTDTLPANFVFISDSASIAPSEILPGKITWTGIQVPAQSTLDITLSARVLSSARPGDHVNTATLTDPVTGDSVVPPSTATVRLLADPVFDCGDVIGKVFDDINGDGYQNPPPGGITDQTYAGGKGGKLSTPPVARTEKGIPNVRLVTVDGSIITTDQNGLYSVPCAALPANNGSNFILKLDTRTLPSGYRVTTENPRVVRLTPGMMTELNFGAAIGKVVRVDLDASAFGRTSDGKIALSEPLKRGISKLLPQIAGEAINLRLTFHVPQNADAADVKAARQMLRAADRHIKREWRKVGRTRLLVEQAIARVGR